jgi:hypothetical protein
MVRSLQSQQPHLLSTSDAALLFGCFSVYDFLDPQKQDTLLAGYIFGIAAGQVIVFILVRYVIVVREYLVGGNSEKNAAVEAPDGHVRLKRSSLVNPRRETRRSLSLEFL